MNEIWIYSLVSVFIVSLISFIGIFTLSIKTDRLSKILLYLVSFSAGALFGDAFLHLLPEIVKEFGMNTKISLSILGGIVLFFVTEKFIHWQHCHAPQKKGHVHTFAIMNLIGDGFHNLLDGLIVGASYLISIPTGVATTTAVLFHEIPQEIGDFGVLLHGGFSKSRALFLNFLSASLAVIGVIISLLLAKFVEGVTFYIIPIAIGGFIYIAGSDLIPELHKEFTTKKAMIELTMFIFGILAMFLLLFLE
ncbi:MAG TPA: ZIP family metal transporter [Candidatus Nanoarchaeia archaeon]|nr:ZIP family metal transporter [Candidatus Nanoarchaeia archaeon]